MVKRDSSKDSVDVRLTSQGIEYCEEDSFAVPGKSLVQNITLHNSPGSNVINQSPGSSVNQNFSEAKNILNQMLSTAQGDDTIDTERKEEIVECISEVEDTIDRGGKPKFAMRSLLSLIGNISSLSGFGMSLAQLIPG